MTPRFDPPADATAEDCRRALAASRQEADELRAELEETTRGVVAL